MDVSTATVGFFRFLTPMFPLRQGFEEDGWIVKV